MKKQIKRITAVAAAAALAISFTFPAELGLADLGVGGNAIAASAESSGNCGDSGRMRWLHSVMRMGRVIPRLTRRQCTTF